MSQNIRSPQLMQFLVSPAGRWIRGIIGLALFTGGIQAANMLGFVVAVIGIEAMAAGLFDFTLMAPFFQAPVQGDQVRPLLKAQNEAKRRQPKKGKESDDDQKAA